MTNGKSYLCSEFVFGGALILVSANKIAIAKSVVAARVWSVFVVTHRSILFIYFSGQAATEVGVIFFFFSGEVLHVEGSRSAVRPYRWLVACALIWRVRVSRWA